MKKLILILLLFFISPVQASIISDLRIHNLTSDQMKQECPIENAIRCADIHSNIYIDKEYSDKNADIIIAISVLAITLYAIDTVLLLRG